MHYFISARHAGRYYPRWEYLYYTKREAIKLYREKHGLVGKHLTLTVSTRV